MKAARAFVAFDDDVKRISRCARRPGLKTQNLRRDLTGRVVAALVLAPGVPLTHPEPHWTAALARRANVEVIGDIELGIFAASAPNQMRVPARSRLPAPTERSTTAALIAHLLNGAGRDAQMGRKHRRAGAGALQRWGAQRAYVLEVILVPN